MQEANAQGIEIYFQDVGGADWGDWKVTPHPPHIPDDRVVHFMVKGLIHDLMISLEWDEVQEETRRYETSAKVLTVWSRGRLEGLGSWVDF